MTQRTEGGGPTIGTVGGSTHIGDVHHHASPVDQKTLARINELLDKKDLELAEREREKEEWVKKYQDLEARLKAEPEKSDQSQRVAELVHQGDFEEAGTLLDDALSESETDVERTAEYHYRRGRLFELQFEPLKALPHFESSYRYRPTSPEYAAAFAGLLQKQRQYDEADKVYSQNLRLLRVGAKDNPAAYLPNVAMTLNNLAILYRATQRMEPAEQAFDEALKT